MQSKYAQEVAVEERLGVELEYIDDWDYQNVINNPGQLGNIYPWVYQDRQNTYASRYASFEMAGMKILNDMIEKDKEK